MIRLVAAGAIFLSLWLLFVFQISLSELIAGIVASAATLFAAWKMLRTVPTCFEPRARWVAQVWRIPGMICTDIWLLVKHLIRRASGRPSRSSFETAPLRPAKGQCRAASQRALATLLFSIAPNSVVLRIDAQTGDVLFHHLEPAPVPEVLRSLED